MVSVYITEPKSTSKSKKPIGKICVKCGIIDSITPYFQKLKKQIEIEEEKERQTIGYHEKPKHQREHPFTCWHCRSKRYSVKEKIGPMWASYPNSDGSINYQLNNPYISYTCAKCKEISRTSLQMPYPLPKKYLQHPKD